MTVWQIASIPFWMLAGYGMGASLVMVIAGCREAVAKDLAELRVSIINLTFWLLVSGAAFLIAAKAAS